MGWARASVRLVEGAVTHIPIARDVLAVYQDFERQLVRVVGGHLADIKAAQQTAVDAGQTNGPTSPSPTDVLHSLLDRSMYTKPDDSRNALYLSLLGELMPDEARILAAVSDGSVFPVIHVAEPGGTGNPTIMLENASTVGRAAGVSLPRHTPLYLTRMLRLGLVEIGPEGSGAMNDEYEMLLTDAAVNLALARGRRGVRAARVIRRTVRISDLGQELWEAAK